MVQSPGDGSSRGLCSLQITTQEVPSLGKLSRLGHLRRGGFVTCRGLRVLRALRDLGRWWFSWATAGVRPCATRTPRTPKTLSSALSCSLAPAQKVDGLLGPHFYSALSSRDAKHVTPPHWSPRGWRQPRGDLAVNINASAQAPG